MRENANALTTMPNNLAFIINDVLALLPIIDYKSIFEKDGFFHSLTPKMKNKVRLIQFYK